MISVFKRYDPDTLDLVYQSVNTAKKDLTFLRLDSLFWEKIKDYVEKKFNIKLNYIVVSSVIVVIAIILLLLNY